LQSNVLSGPGSGARMRGRAAGDRRRALAGIRWFSPTTWVMKPFPEIPGRRQTKRRIGFF